MPTKQSVGMKSRHGRDSVAFKLGQILLKAGRITPQQLDEALRHQVIHGGKLGTNLVELGFITEHELSLVLGHKLGVPFIKQEQVLALTPEIAGLIPAEMATRFRVIPIETEKRRLSLGMIDPSDLEAIDAISFYTGMIVRPVVCPELLLNRLHEKFYGIRTKPRPFVTPPTKPSTGDDPVPPPAQPAQPEEPVGTKPEPHAIEEYEIPMFDEFQGFDSLGGDQFDDLFLSSSFHSAASLDKVSAELADARSRDSIADTVLTFLGIAFPVEAFILVRQEFFTGWKARIRGEECRSFLEFSAPIKEPSVLSHVMGTRNLFLGPVPDTPVNRELTRCLGGRRHGHALILPLMITDRVIALLYLEGEAEQLTARLNEVQKLALKTAMAFEILILRNKILMS